MRNPSVPILVSVSAIFWVLPLARGQYVLDNSLQSGARRVNRSMGESDYSSRNNLVSGLVSGGREFRGNDDASTSWRTGDMVSPWAFRDELGTDELFRFRARSLSFGNLDQFRALDINRTMDPVYSGIAPVSGRDIGNLARARRQGMDVQFPLAGRDAGMPRLTVTYGARPTALDRAGLTNDLMGVLIVGGRPMKVEASDLRGYRIVPYRSEFDTIPRQAEPADSGDEFDVPETGPPAEPSGAGNGRRPGSTVPSGLESLWEPSVQIGQELLAALQPEFFESGPGGQMMMDAGAIDSRAGQIQTEWYEPLVASRTAEPGADVYNDLVKEIETFRTQLLGDPVSPYPKQPSDEVLNDVTLEDPMFRKMQEAELARQEAMRQATSLPQTNDPAESPEILEPSLPANLDRLVKTLDYELPRVGSMAGNTNTRVNELFREAEAHMAAGKYFEAERAYKHILRRRQSHQLAGVGLVHAQLGAGLVRSSALNLRQHFTQYPELIATRYQAQLLPDQPRLKWVQERVDHMIAMSDRVEGPLMLAYLGYQTGSQKLVRYGLDLAMARLPKDPLMPLLRRIWLESKQADEQPTKPGVQADQPVGEAGEAEGQAVAEPAAESAAVEEPALTK